MKGVNMKQRLWHIDLIPLLPDDLLYNLWVDCIKISEELSMTGEPNGEINDEFAKRIINYMPDDFYTYVMVYVKDECVRRGLQFTYENISYFENNMVLYAGRQNFTLTDRPFLFQGWMTTRYLQQNILLLEELYDNEEIELKDWFKIVNGVRNMSVLCQETFDTLFS